ncbi:MAG: GGDEF domain-containing protein [Actinomycetota bacterium]
MGDVIDELPCGLVEIDAAAVIVSANAPFAGLIGQPAPALTGHNIAEFVRSAANAATVTDSHLPALGYVTGANGIEHPVLIETGPETEGRRYVVFFDATAQRGFADDLQGRHALTERTQTRLELVIASSIAFAAANTEDELAAVLVDTTAKAYAAENAVVYLINDAGQFQFVAGTNPFSDLDDLETLTGQARALPGVVKISGVDEARALSPAVAAAFERSGVHAMIIAPLHQPDQPLGVLGIFFHHPRVFDEQASPLADALAGQAGRSIANLRLRAQLRHAATHDDATGLPNRRLLEEKLEQDLGSDPGLMSVVFIDLDGFKRVNDRLGHHIGDQLLREVGLRLQETVRNEDVVARYGGDEFVVVSQVSKEQDAMDLAERLRRQLGASYPMLPAGLHVTASIGVAIGPAHELPVGGEHLLRAADQAMYRAKLSGGDVVVNAAP